MHYFSSNLYTIVISHFTPDFLLPRETSLMAFWSFATNYIFPFMCSDKNTVLWLNSVQFKEITDTLNLIWALASYSWSGSRGGGPVSCFLWVLEPHLCLYFCFLEFYGGREKSRPWNVGWLAVLVQVLLLPPKPGLFWLVCLRYGILLILECQISKQSFENHPPSSL